MTAPQIPIDFGAKARDLGMAQAEHHANQVHDEWSQQAYRFFEIWVRERRESFQMEDFREHVEFVLPAPPSLRAFGAIAVKAMKAGLIRKIGIKAVKNPNAHKANANVWVRVRKR